MISRTAPEIKTPLPGPKAKALVEKDHALLSPSFTRDYPMVAVQGDGLWVEDIDGNWFLDLAAGIAVTSTGHVHPDVVKAIKDQADKLLHMSGTDFYYPEQVNLAESLYEIIPISGPKRAFFGNSGAEAVEGALKLARYHTKRQNIIAFYGAFHGRTMGALSVTCSKRTQRKGFWPLIPGTFHAPYPNWPHTNRKAAPEEIAASCLDFIENTLFKRQLDPEEVAAIIVEPIQGEGGYLVPPDNFLPGLRALTRKHGILLICDEVQSGNGRTGKPYACEHWGVEPDILCTAKGIASGMPLGVFVSKAEVMNWVPGSHASTFGGNPVSCAAAMATLKLLKGGLIENARVQGDYFLGQLRELAGKYPVIGDVRGKGLMIAVDFYQPGLTWEKANQLREVVIQGMFQRGVLILGCGESAVRMSPGLILTRQQVDVAVGILDAVVKGL